jgi:hypothetical protein
MQAVTSFFTKLLTGAGATLTGWAGWLVRLLIGSVLELIAEKYKAAREESARQAEIKAKDEALLKEYIDAVSKGEGLSREERRKIAERLLNRSV